MFSEEENQKGIARRDFLKQAAITGTIVAASDTLLSYPTTAPIWQTEWRSAFLPKPYHFLRTPVFCPG